MPRTTFESVLELELLIHYREVDLNSGGWDIIRVNRLCALLRISNAELARFIRVTPSALTGYCHGKFPAPIRLLLDLVEQSAHQKYLGRPPKHRLIPEI